MGDKLKRFNIYMTKEELSRLKFVIFLIGIGAFIFMDTGFFKTLDDSIKIMIYLLLWGAFVFLKIDIMNTKEIGLQIKDIYLDKKLNWFEKGKMFGNLGMNLLHEAGEMWQIGKDEQFQRTEGTAELYYNETERKWTDSSGEVAHK